MGKGSGKSPRDGEKFEEFVDRRRAARMAMVDEFDPETRSLIHNYGLTVVKAFVDIGVTKPNHIKHLVETVLNEFSPSRGSYAKQGMRTAVDEPRP